MADRTLRFSTSVAFLCLAMGWAGVATATCTVPNQLTNGQTADASQVMANINSVKDCINNAPAGSTGALQTNAGSGSFGSVGPLTNGQLAIGSTGNSPQAANLTAGPGITITNAPGAITIGTAAAASTGLYDISMGVPTSFTNINIGGNSSVVTNGARALTVKAGTSTPTSPTLYGVAIPVPATTPYMVAVLALPNFPPVRYSGVAVGYYDSTTGKLVVLSSFNGSAFGFPGYSFSNWASATSRGAGSEPSTPRAANYGPTWFGIKDNGTTISFLMSNDGANFYPLPFSQTKAGGYLAAYDRIFIGLFNDAESGSEGSANNNVSVTYLAYDPNGLTRVAGP